MMKEERYHQRHEYNFKQQSGNLSAPISHSVTGPDAQQVPAIKSNKVWPTPTCTLYVKVRHRDEAKSAGSQGAYYQDKNSRM